MDEREDWMMDDKMVKLAEAHRMDQLQRIDLQGEDREFRRAYIGAVNPTTDLHTEAERDVHHALMMAEADQIATETTREERAAWFAALPRADRRAVAARMAEGVAAGLNALTGGPGATTNARGLHTRLRDVFADRMGLARHPRIPGELYEVDRDRRTYEPLNRETGRGYRAQVRARLIRRLRHARQVWVGILDRG